MVNKVRSMAGKKGAEIKHKTRYEILKELSGLYDKKNLNWFMTEWRLRIRPIRKYGTCGCLRGQKLMEMLLTLVSEDRKAMGIWLPSPISIRSETLVERSIWIIMADCS